MDATIIVVEDEPGIRATLCGILMEDAGYKVIGLERGADALQMIRRSPFDVLIADIRLPDVSGLEILELAKEINPDAAVIVMTGYASVETAVDAVNQGAYAYFVKPVNPDEIKTTIANALKQQRLSLENKKLVEDLQRTNKLLLEANAELQKKINERNRVRKALQESEERYRDLFENANDLIQSVTPDGRFLYVNKAWREMLGYSEEEVANLRLWDIIHPDSIPHCREVFQKVISGETANNIETVFMAKDGKLITVEGNANAWSKEGKVVATRGIFRGITERKRAEEELRVKDNAIASSINAIAMADLEGNLKYVNDSFLKMWGYENDNEVLGKQAVQFWQSEGKALEVVKALEEKGGWVGELVAKRKDGSFFDTQISTSIAVDETGKPIRRMASFIDITERKQAEELYNTLANRSPVGVYIVQDGKCQFANPQFQKYTGYTEDELLGMEPLSIVHPEDRESVRENAVEMLKGNRLSPYEFRFIGKGGEAIWAMETVTSIHYKGKRATLGNFMDITERKRAEEALRDSRRRFRDLTNLLPQSVWEMDERGTFTFANQEAFRSHGYVSEELTEPLNATQVFIPEDRDRMLENTRRMLSGEELGGMEYIALRKDGSTFPVLVYAAPIIHEGKSAGLRGVTIDITERRRMEEALRESEKRFRGLANFLPLAVFEMDDEGSFTFVNRQGFETFGYSMGEITEALNDPQMSVPDGPTAPRLFVPEDRDRVRENEERVLNGEDIGNVEYTAVRRDGSTFPVEVFYAPIIHAGKRTGLRGILIDITERKQMELELREKNEQLDVQNEELQSQTEELMLQQEELIEKTREVERANRLKSEFLSGMSHELRTPLNVIIGFSELMVDEVPGKTNEEQRQCLNDILDSGRHLLNLINGVLDLARIESGKVELKLENIALTEVIESLTRAMMPVLAPRKQSLDAEIEERLPLVYADEVKLGQVLLNLVDNSSKFTPDGGKLKIEAVREGDWCRVSVVDNGLGIREEDQERIFEPFCQLDNPLVKERGGTGLGLALVKQIVERYGGRIWVESEPGRGSRFNFTLPLATSS